MSCYRTKKLRACLTRLLLVPLLAAGCETKDGDQVGVPQPVPIPGPDAAFIRSTGAALTSDVEIHLVGLPGAVSGRGQVEVENARSKAAGSATSTAAGSFSLFVMAREKDVITVRFVGATDDASVEVGAASTAHLIGPPAETPGVTPVTIASAGTVRVRGTYAGGEVIVVNLTTGDVVSATVSGPFELEIPGNSGDALHVYGEGDPLNGPWELVVP